jgi:hypothetical protein
MPENIAIKPILILREVGLIKKTAPIVMSITPMIFARI